MTPYAIGERDQHLHARIAAGLIPARPTDQRARMAWYDTHLRCAFVHPSGWRCLIDHDYGQTHCYMHGGPPESADPFVPPVEAPKVQRKPRTL